MIGFVSLDLRIHRPDCYSPYVCSSAALTGRWSTASSTARRAASASLSHTTCTAAWKTWCSTTSRPRWCSTTTRSTSGSPTPSTHRCPPDADEPRPPRTSSQPPLSDWGRVKVGVWFSCKKTPQTTNQKHSLQHSCQPPWSSIYFLREHFRRAFFLRLLDLHKEVLNVCECEKKWPKEGRKRRRRCQFQVDSPRCYLKEKPPPRLRNIPTVTPSSHLRVSWPERTPPGVSSPFEANKWCSMMRPRTLLHIDCCWGILGGGVKQFSSGGQKLAFLLTAKLLCLFQFVLILVPVFKRQQHSWTRDQSVNVGGGGAERVFFIFLFFFDVQYKVQQKRIRST